MFKVKFIRDFEGHKAGEVVEMDAGQVYVFQEWAAIEVLEDLTPNLQPDPVTPSKSKDKKKAK